MPVHPAETFFGGLMAPAKLETAPTFPTMTPARLETVTTDTERIPATEETIATGRQMA